MTRRTGNLPYRTELRRGPQPPEPDVPDYVGELTGQRGMNGVDQRRIESIVSNMYDN